MEKDMHADVDNDGWQRFLERLKRLWGKLRGVGPASPNAGQPNHSMARNEPRSCRTRRSIVRNASIYGRYSSRPNLEKTIGWVSRPGLSAQLQNS